MKATAWPGIPRSFPPPPDPAERGPVGPAGEIGATGGSGAPAYLSRQTDVTLDDVDAIVRTYGTDPVNITLPTALGNPGRTVRVYRYASPTPNIYAQSGDDIEHTAGNSDSAFTLSGWSGEFISTGSGTWLARLIAA